MTEIICAVITGIFGILVAVLTARIKKSEEKQERRATLRQRESLLSLRMMDATLQLSVVCSNALTGGQNNGNVEAARKAAEDVAAEYHQFMQEITAQQVGK